MKYKNYLSRILLVSLLLISTCSCSKEEPIEEEKVYQYIEPCNDANLFNYLNKDVKDLLFKANTGSSLDDNQLKMFNAKLYQGEVKDIDGNIVKFSELNDCDIVFEVVSIYCSHCRVQIQKHNDSLVENNPNLKFIQFFAEGDWQEIEEFYEENGKTVPEDIIIIPEDEKLLDYIIDIGVNLTPDLLCFKNGYLTWPQVGITSSLAFDRFYDIAFNNAFDSSLLVDEKGVSIFENRRTVEDVKNDLGNIAIDKLVALDNDGNTENLTYQIMGQTLDYSDLYKTEDLNLPTVDFSQYQDKNVAIIYFYMTGLPEIDQSALELVNKIIKAHPELSFINLIIEDDVSSFAKYKECGTELGGVTISSRSSLPKDFSKIAAYNYPTVNFVEKGTYVGTYSSVSDIEGFNEAYKLFVGDNSIAHIN